ncbi:helix-turn-helix domain-containing protein [Cohaesibacter sp. CAU 1516]|uniref:XRE family transcriptional regulator n=1 Tax=Cohaesibacter sp. CAU 1516 TaxID=2576038 RepID=UPI0010FE2D20|nr:helix-turn-helix domain-containing protein [Cohaesibacter sp. CAU 1516]TLP42657.1 helix-turn-helix domain-containing protein [Cohaesibacter sp. CAU 1516]
MKMKIKSIRKQKRMTQMELAEASGLSQSYIGAMESKNIAKLPSMDALIAIANALDVRASDLIDDARPVAVAGRVGAGAKVPLFDAYAKGDGIYHVACPSDLPFDTHIVAVEVEGESMTPLYSSGDVLFYSRDVIGVPNEALGRICICEDENGDVWVKHIKPGSEPGKFHLISTNPMIDNMLDTKLKWASPVKISLPADLVQKLDF